MTAATITGWGKCVPPAILSNKDLSTFLDTSDEWIHSRTGMRERRISHVGSSELAYVATCHALACAGRDIDDIDLLIVATCTPDSLLPNVSSKVLQKLGTNRVACLDINTACTGFMTGISIASAMIKAKTYKRIVVSGADCITHIMPWEQRSVSVLFGDAAGAVVLEATNQDEGVLSEKSVCISEMRDILEIEYGCPAPFDCFERFVHFNFEGPEIFKAAVQGMVDASKEVMAKAGLSPKDIDICIPHQANQRILSAVAKRSHLTDQTLYSNIARYANTSAATIPVAMTEALEEGLLKPKANLLLPAFGGGLTCSSHCLRWGERVTPISTSDVTLPPCPYTALELVAQMLKQRKPNRVLNPTLLSAAN